MSAMMARQGGRVQLEQSDMRLALNMCAMVTGGFSCTTIEEMAQYVIKKPRAKVRQEKKQGVEFPGHQKVKATIGRLLAVLCQNQMNVCLPCQNGTAKNLQICWRCKGAGAPPPERHRPPTPEPTPSLPRTPPAPPGDNEGAQSSQINNLPLGYVYSHARVPSKQCFKLDAYAQDSQPNTHYNPDMLTDEGTSSG